MANYPNGLLTPPTITSGYGWRIHPITGVRTFHYGVDSIGHPNGWNRAPEPGTVMWAGYNGGEGYSVHIRNGERLWKLFHHEQLDVEYGQELYPAHITGRTGTTGASTGVHCHLELWIDGVGSVDPYAWIADNLGAPAGGGGTPFTPNGRIQPMATVYRRGSSPDAEFALAGDSPGTRANWINTRNESLWKGWVAAHGPYVMVSEADYDLFRGLYTGPVATSGGGEVKLPADLKVTADNTKLEAAVAALTGEVVKLTAATKALNPPDPK